VLPHLRRAHIGVARQASSEGRRSLEPGPLDLPRGLDAVAHGRAELSEAVAGQLVIVDTWHLAVYLRCAGVDAGLPRGRIEMRFW
jgi:hypothetical protein